MIKRTPAVADHVDDDDDEGHSRNHNHRPWLSIIVRIRACAGQAFIYFNASRPRECLSAVDEIIPRQMSVGEKERAAQPAKPRRWVILIRKTAGVPLSLSFTSSLCADEMLCVRALRVCPRAAFTILYGCAPHPAMMRGLDLQFQSEKSTDCWGIFICTEICTWPVSPSPLCAAVRKSDHQWLVSTLLILLIRHLSALWYRKLLFYL